MSPKAEQVDDSLYDEEGNWRGVGAAEPITVEELEAHHADIEFHDPDGNWWGIDADQPEAFVPEEVPVFHPTPEEQQAAYGPGAGASESDPRRAEARGQEEDWGGSAVENPNADVPPAGVEADEEDVDLDVMTKAELLDYADELGIDVPASGSKAEIRAAIDEVLAEEPSDDEHGD